MTDSGKTTENDVYIYENTYYSLALSGFKIMSHDTNVCDGSETMSCLCVWIL